MAGAMEKVTAEVVAKKIDTIARWLIALGAVIGLVVRSHPQVSQIITAVGAVVAIISGKRIVALIKWVKGWVYKGRHAGLYVTDFSAETSPPNRYVGTTIRRCAASTVSCGSPADHGKEYWP
jgi:hypothetical protein